MANTDKPDKNQLIKSLIEAKLTLPEIMNVLKTFGIPATENEIVGYPGAPPRAKGAGMYGAPLTSKVSFKPKSKTQRAREVLADYGDTEDASPEVLQKLFTPAHEELIKQEHEEREVRLRAKQQQNNFKNFKSGKDDGPPEDGPPVKKYDYLNQNNSVGGDQGHGSNLPKGSQSGPTWKEVKKAVEDAKEETVKKILETSGDPVDVIKQSGETIRKALDGVASRFKTNADGFESTIKSTGASLVESLDNIYDIIEKQQLFNRTKASAGGGETPLMEPQTEAGDRGGGGSLFDTFKNIPTKLLSAAIGFLLKSGKALTVAAVYEMLQRIKHDDANHTARTQDRQTAEMAANLIGGILGKPNLGSVFHEDDEDKKQPVLGGWLDYWKNGGTIWGALTGKGPGGSQQTSPTTPPVEPPKEPEHKEESGGGGGSWWSWITGGVSDLLFGKKEGDATVSESTETHVEADDTLTITADELVFKRKNSDDPPDFTESTEGKGNKESVPSFNDRFNGGKGYAEGGVSEGGNIRVSPGETVSSAKTGVSSTVPGVPNKQDQVSMNVPSGTTVTPAKIHGPMAGMADSQYDQDWMVAKHNASILHPGTSRTQSGRSLPEALKNNPQWGLHEWEGGDAIQPGGPKGRSMFGGNEYNELKAEEGGMNKGETPFQTFKDSPYKGKPLDDPWTDKMTHQGLFNSLGMEQEISYKKKQKAIPEAWGPRVDIPYDKSNPVTAPNRYNSPQAAWPSSEGTHMRFGAKGYGQLVPNSKSGEMDYIPNFPDATSGTAYNMYLAQKKYSGQTLGQAMHGWSSGIRSGNAGMDPNNKITPEYLSNPDTMIPLMQRMAKEEGFTNKMSEQDYRNALGMANYGSKESWENAQIYGQSTSFNPAMNFGGGDTTGANFNGRPGAINDDAGKVSVGQVTSASDDDNNLSPTTSSPSVTDPLPDKAADVTAAEGGSTPAYQPYQGTPRGGGGDDNNSSGGKGSNDSPNQPQKADQKGSTPDYNQYFGTDDMH